MQGNGGPERREGVSEGACADQDGETDTLQRPERRGAPRDVSPALTGTEAPPPTHTSMGGTFVFPANRLPSAFHSVDPASFRFTQSPKTSDSWSEDGLALIPTFWKLILKSQSPSKSHRAPSLFLCVAHD